MSAEFYRQLVERGVFAMLVVEPGGTVAYANARAVALLESDPLGRPFAQMFTADVQRSAAAYLAEVGASDGGSQIFFSGSARGRDGSVRALQMTGASRLGDPAVAGLVFGLVDETQARERQEALERLALTDVLTGLPNRALLLDRIGQVQRSARPGALAYIDLDRFKGINDRFGHSAGDQLLTVLAARLADAVPPDATVARLGGDEFVLLLPDVSLVEATEITEVACASLRMPVPLAVSTLRITCCAGVAAVAAGADSDEVLRRADVAMYAAKAAGGNQVMSDGPHVDSWAHEQRTLEEQLAQANADRLRLRAESRTDGLTGLPNRRALDEVLPFLSARAVRSSQPFSVIFVDIDHFGSYNHAHGDARGDRMLKSVAATLAAVCRTTDVAYRKGGEEFVVTLPDTPLDTALVIAERTRAAIEGQRHPHGGEAASAVVTVTAAAAAWQPGVEAADVVEAAAAAVYKAKTEHRRNTVSSAEPAPIAGIGPSETPNLPRQSRGGVPLSAIEQHVT